MRKEKKIISLLLLILLLLSFCACSVVLPEPQEMSSDDEAQAMSFSKGECKSEMSVGDFEFFKVKIKMDYEYLVRWSSSNPAVATVDSTGRVDAIAPGEAVITASAMKAELDFPLTVTKAKEEPLNKTTAFTANKVTEEQNKLNEENVNVYALLVNTEKNCVTAYTYNNNGTYNVAVRSMVCSIGKDIEEQYARVDLREEWYQNNEYYHHYATRFANIYFCSAPYSSMSTDSLITDLYNTLGTANQSTDIWLSSDDAEWIYKNCSDTTLVKLSADASVPMGVPVALTLNEQSPFKNWDPTDTDSNNPWNDKKPYFAGVEDIKVNIGDSVDLYEGVSVFDSFSKPMDMRSDVKIYGSVNKNREGTYVITYQCTDEFNRTGRADRVVSVVSPES